MADRRLVQQYGSDLSRFWAREDGVNYRVYRQEMDDVIDQVKANSEMNEVSAKRNKNGWNYGGSIPWAFLLEWLKMTGHRVDQFARSKELRAEFITWMQDRDRRAFIADNGYLKTSFRR